MATEDQDELLEELEELEAENALEDLDDEEIAAPSQSIFSN
jgi:hypothetical protein